jgi:hypothetical protein
VRHREGPAGDHGHHVYGLATNRQVSSRIVSECPTIRSEPSGATSEHIAYGHMNGGCPGAMPGLGQQSRRG